MDRTASAPPTMLPAPSRRDERARRARDTTLRVIPEILRLHPRARHGIHRAEQFVDPDPVNTTALHPHPRKTSLQIRLRCSDTLAAAAALSERPYATARRASLGIAPTSSLHKTRPLASPNVAVLNMASAAKPGGGFLDGANNQEEFLCARSTLYPSLWEGHYRLPDVSAIHSPDILVFRDSLPEANDLLKRDWYYVDVLSAAMFRFADTRDGGACSCGVSYCDRHRDLVLRKMRAVLRVAQRKGVEKLILGAWGCGGSAANPVREIAKCWRKVLAGAPRQRRPNSEQWDCVREVVFAIPDRTMLREFESVFSDILAPDAPSLPSPPLVDGVADDMSAEIDLSGASDSVSITISRIAAIEMQIEQARNFRLKQTLRAQLAALNRELAQGVAAQNLRDGDMTTDDDEDDDDDDFVFTRQSDCDDQQDENGVNSFYNFDENDVPSDSSSNDTTTFDSYAFQPSRRPSVLRAATTDSQNPALALLRPTSSHSSSHQSFSPRFDPHGWFHGSVDELTRELKLGPPGLDGGSGSLGSPGLVDENQGTELTSSGLEVGLVGERLDEVRLRGF